MIKYYLKHGEQNAIETPTLTYLLRYAITSELQQAIHKERSNCDEIQSSGAGFFLPSEDAQQTKQKIERHIVFLRSSALSVLREQKDAKHVMRLGSFLLDGIGA